MSPETTPSSLTPDVEFHFSTSDDGNMYALDLEDKIAILSSDRQTHETSIVLQIKDKTEKSYDVYVRIPSTFFPHFVEALRLKEQVMTINNKRNPSMREKLAALGKLETSLEHIETKLPKHASAHFLIQLLKAELNSMINDEKLQPF